MQLTKCYELVDRVAPFVLSERYIKDCNGYDNSGVLIDGGREITRVLFALDLSSAAVREAIAWGAQLIVTHHPAIYTPIRSITAEGAGAQVLQAVQAGISVISAHINLDMAPNGIDESLMQGLGGSAALDVLERVEGGGYGRVYDVAPTEFAQFVAAVKEKFQTERVVVYGDRPVKRVASFCGAGMMDESVNFARSAGADTFVSSDPKHHLIASAVEGGMNVVILTHYAAELYGFTRFYGALKEKFNGEGVESKLFTDLSLI